MTPGPTESETFILGAGFSRSIGTSMPLVSHLVTPLQRILDGSQGTRAAVFPPVDNVELFLSSLATPPPFLDEAVNFYNRGLFVEATRGLAETVFRAQQHALGSPLPQWLRGLVHTWHERRSTVITLNYDTLVESAVMSLDLNGSAGAKVEPQFTYASPVRFAASEWAATSNPYINGQPTFTLCKLHGSLSWWRSGPVQQSPLDVEMWKDTFNSAVRAPWGDVVRRVMTGEPILVPPTLAKSSYFDNDLIRANWKRAHEGLSNADTIVIMGYSFPTGDMQMSALLGTVGAQNKQVIVVDPDPEVRARVLHATRVEEDRIFLFDGEQPITSWAEQWARDPSNPPIDS